MTSSLHYCVFLCLLVGILCEDCVIDNRSPDLLWEHQLHVDLNSRYDYAPQNCSDTNVIVQIIVKNFKFTNDEQVFTVNTWVYLSWYDERLKWDPPKYGNIKKIEIESSQIWTPMLILHNSKKDQTLIQDFMIPNEVQNTGHVHCMLRWKYEAECVSQMKDWPYDTRKCKLELGEWKTPRHKVNFTFNGTRGVTMFGAEYGPGWDIIGFESTEDPNKNVQLSLTFELERQEAGLGELVFVPSLIVFTLTITSLVLDTREGIRLKIACFSLFIHFGLLSEINDIIPVHSVDTPLVLLYARSSIILNMFVVILTLILIVIRRTTVPPPLLVSSLNKNVFSSHAKFLIWPRWDAEVDIGLVSEEADGAKVAEEWTDFANILNSVCLLVFVIVYFILFFAYMPKPIVSTLVA